MFDQMGPKQARLMAEKLETYEEFEQATALGFLLFQGDFSSKPEIVSHRDIRPHKAVLFALSERSMAMNATSRTWNA